MLCFDNVKLDYFELINFNSSKISFLNSFRVKHLYLKNSDISFSPMNFNISRLETLEVKGSLNSILIRIIEGNNLKTLIFHTNKLDKQRLKSCCQILK